MSEPILVVTALDSYYEDFQALYKVSLTLNEGEVVAIIGANGAGKTTLLRSIVGLIKSKSEQVKYRGQAIGSLRADQIAATGIAMVPEGRQLFPSLTVEENLLIGGRIKRAGPWSLDAIYELFPVLSERRKQASTSLSGGQQQMVAIGRALMSNPSVILFDEISLGLAPVIIKNIYEALPGIVQDGMTAVIVEQDITKALSVSSRVYCLQEGRVSLQGNSSSVSREDISRAYFGIS
ncbi:ABC transporter ATP-binding protein [Granulosicoccus antarcticus]|uniref:High-affinity branched-chain amino acid transport ATP-binding protein LivF n=1 Tax=Granulosicoccus antarcticus IMCC3135 TaxID=1192854 RepID=A0A2Z2NVH6_9GAMM|nr:ABC transporter ATP-binding protein [Granulosicoccus antarcticus]ASJ73728.1 High-affinity branched-chain amino acid transport ATP-binding protein LivF [Granulosicoccus antarcticus IMCC3135]